MEIKEIKNLTFKEKDRLLRSVFMEYRKSKMIIEGYEFNNYYPVLSGLVIKEGDAPYQLETNLIQNLEKKENCQKFIETIDYVLERLDERSREAIIQEFYEENTSHWWINYYSRSTYYRVKHQAMEEMLFYLLQ